MLPKVWSIFIILHNQSYIGTWTGKFLFLSLKFSGRCSPKINTVFCSLICTARLLYLCRILFKSVGLWTGTWVHLYGSDWIMRRKGVSVIECFNTFILNYLFDTFYLSFRLIPISQQCVIFWNDLWFICIQ